jgi:hypothetical protein
LTSPRSHFVLWRRQFRQALYDLFAEPVTVLPVVVAAFVVVVVAVFGFVVVVVVGFGFVGAVILPCPMSTIM